MKGFFNIQNKMRKKTIFMRISAVLLSRSLSLSTHKYFESYLFLSFYFYLTPCFLCGLLYARTLIICRKTVRFFFVSDFSDIDRIFVYFCVFKKNCSSVCYTSKTGFHINTQHSCTINWPVNGK